MNVGFIGVGKLGKDAAEVMAEKHNVVGYDITEVQPENFKMVPTIKDACEGRELIFVAVPTPHHPDYDGRYPTSHLENKDFNYGIVKEVLVEVNKHVSKDQLIVLISTVLLTLFLLWVALSTDNLLKTSSWIFSGSVSTTLLVARSCPAVL